MAKHGESLRFQTSGRANGFHARGVIDRVVVADPASHHFGKDFRESTERALILRLAFLKQVSDELEHGAGKRNAPAPVRRSVNGSREPQWIPPRARWKYLMSKVGTPHLRKTFLNAMKAVEVAYPQLTGLFDCRPAHRVPTSALETSIGFVSSISRSETNITASASKQTSKKRPKIAYRSSLGVCFHGKTEEVISSLNQRTLRGGVDLIFTSPPFPLNNKKRYGNLKGQDYIDWIAGFAAKFKHVLKPRGSIVIEVGNAWEPGKPVMSPLALKALLAFLEAGQFHLCQQFIWHNPARLPSPAQWVTVDRIRVKDSFTHLWWMSPSVWPRASNRRILKPYSEAMLDLLRRKRYNSGKRPSEHDIGSKSFFSNNGGAIPSNVISLSNTTATGPYLEHCRAKKLTPHPARMPSGLAEFFIKFLTKPGDLVLDPFAGSNTTGAAAESLGRRWISIEANIEYIRGSRGRFPGLR